MSQARRYMTKQQRAVLDMLATQTHRSVSALELAKQLHTAGIPVGTATVYRHLDKLERQGLVHKWNTDTGASWQYCDRSRCLLLQCESCGAVQHLDCDHLSELYEHLSLEHGFAVTPRKTVLLGLCKTCQGKEATR